MPPYAESIIVRCLRRVASTVYHYPRWFFYPQILLFAFCIYYTVAHLEFSTERNALVGSEKRYHQNFLKFREEFQAQDDIVVVVESGDLEKNRQFVERLGARLQQETNLFETLFYKGNLQMMGEKALLFLSTHQLQELHYTLDEYQPLIQRFSSATNLVSLFSIINTEFRTFPSDASAQGTDLVDALPALRRIIDQAQFSLVRPGTPPSPGIETLFGAGSEAEQQSYITFDDHRIYLVTARARTDELTRQALDRLRELVKITQYEVPGVNVGITGQPVLEIDEMAQSQRDTALASVVALTLVAFIFIYSYRETGRPTKAVITLVFGLAYTMAYTTATVGHLNILTITFAPILIGLAIDFGVHLITRYEEELRQGQSERVSMERAMVHTGLGIFTGCLTTAGAFFAMALTDFKGIREMGIITGGGMLISLIPMMTLLPILLLRGRQNILDHRLSLAAHRRARLEQAWLQRPWWIVGATVLIAILALFPARTVVFDYNLLNLQTKGLPAVVYEEKLIESADKSVLFAAVIADSIPDAVRLEQQITNLSTVASVDSMAPYLEQDQSAKKPLVEEIRRRARQFEFAPVDLRPVDVAELSQTLWMLRGYLGLARDKVAEAGRDELRVEIGKLIDSITRFRKELFSHTHSSTANKLAVFQQALFRDLHQTFELLTRQTFSERLSVQDLPPSIRHRFVGEHGQFLLQVYPKENVWERKNQEKFIQQLRTVDPDVTGTPVQLYEYTNLLKESYVEAAWYALGVIALLSFIHFKNPFAVILALLPVALGSLWMTALMGLQEVAFNPANIMTLPLVIGIGVTNGIHIITRFAEEHNPSILAKSTGKGVLVSALTTMAGFGSLLLAQHQGIQSLGFVMSIGVATCMFAGLTFLPALLTILARSGWRLKKTQ